MSQSGNPFFGNTDTNTSKNFVDLANALKWEAKADDYDNVALSNQADISSSLMAELLQQSGDSRSPEYKNPADLVTQNGFKDEGDELDEEVNNRIRHDMIEHNKRGDYFFKDKNYEKAIREYDTCIVLQNTVNAAPKFIAESFKKMASCYFALADKHEEQYEQYMAFSVLQPSNYEKYIELAHQQKADYKVCSGRSIQYYLESMRYNLMQSTYVLEKKKHLLAKLVNDKIEKSEVVEELKYDETEQREAFINIADAYFNLAKIYKAKKKFEKAVAYAQEGLTVYDTLTNLTEADLQCIQDGRNMIVDCKRELPLTVPEAHPATQQVDDEKNKGNVVTQPLIYHVLKKSNPGPISKSPPHSPPHSPLTKNSWFAGVGPLKGFSLDAPPALKNPEAEKPSLVMSTLNGSR